MLQEINDKNPISNPKESPQLAFDFDIQYHYNPMLHFLQQHPHCVRLVSGFQPCSEQTHSCKQNNN